MSLIGIGNFYGAPVVVSLVAQRLADIDFAQVVTRVGQCSVASTWRQNSKNIDDSLKLKYGGYGRGEKKTAVGKDAPIRTRKSAISMNLDG
ncbi:hypothetical protein KOI40_01645 [Aestuariicella sp. G3-2]|uniref:hypothetical protein n=1 Tax=Pseudomaricurvus albidus TaxID=2842452 RepID=UPI001C0CB5C3|nr:hypothetical protein [Aestuariicella albida]MBU3068499.1 hypothetical protein [Aestuariicella albida]